MVCFFTAAFLSTARFQHTAFTVLPGSGGFGSFRGHLSTQ